MMCSTPDCLPSFVPHFTSSVGLEQSRSACLQGFNPDCTQRLFLTILNSTKQEILASAKKTAMDLMFLAENADQEEGKEANRLKDMQRAPSHLQEGMFDKRVGQRRVWMAKNEVALQVCTVLSNSDFVLERSITFDITVDNNMV